MFEKKFALKAMVRMLVALSVLSTTVLFTACPLFSKASGKVTKVSAKNDFGLIDGEMDYGITVTVVMENVGETDPIMITPRISCSEGEWDRTQNLTFKKNETKQLTYFFHEPTVNASNCQYGVAVWPKAAE